MKWREPGTWRVRIAIRGGGEPELAVMPISGYSHVISDELTKIIWEEWAERFWGRLWVVWGENCFKCWSERR